MVTLTVGMFTGGLAVLLVRLAANTETMFNLPRAFVGIGGTPIVAGLVACGFVLAAQGLLERTRYGRMLRAAGYNPRAATVSGVPIATVTAGAYVTSGLFAAVAGLLLTGSLETASPTHGRTLLLDVVGATVIGGTSLSGGRGQVWGTVLGVLFLATLGNGADHAQPLGVRHHHRQRLVILVAAIADRAGGRHESRGWRCDIGTASCGRRGRSKELPRRARSARGECRHQRWRSSRAGRRERRREIDADEHPRRKPAPGCGMMRVDGQELRAGESARRDAARGSHSFIRSSPSSEPEIAENLQLAGFPRFGATASHRSRRHPCTRRALLARVGLQRSADDARRTALAPASGSSSRSRVRSTGCARPDPRRTDDVARWVGTRPAARPRSRVAGRWPVDRLHLARAQGRAARMRPRFGPRDGVVVATGHAGDFTVDSLVRHMVGREVQELYPTRRSTPAGGAGSGSAPRDPAGQRHRESV